MPGVHVLTAKRAKKGGHVIAVRRQVARSLRDAAPVGGSRACAASPEEGEADRWRSEATKGKQDPCSRASSPTMPPKPRPSGGRVAPGHGACGLCAGGRSPTKFVSMCKWILQPCFCSC